MRRRITAAIGTALVVVVLAAAPAGAHLCRNVNKPYGAGAVTLEKAKVNPAGREVLLGGWVDLGVILEIAECEGQETNLHVFLHPAAEVGGENGIQLLSPECQEALFASFEGG